MTFWNWVWLTAGLFLVIFWAVHSARHARQKWAVSRLRRAGRYAEAMLLHKQHEVAATTKTYGPQHPLTAIEIAALARLYRERSLYSEAEPLYRQALEVMENVADIDSEPSLALGSVFIAEELALLYVSQGKFAEAEPFYRRALAGYESLLEPSLPNCGSSEAVRRRITTMNNLAEAYRRRGAFADAESLFRQAIDICDKSGTSIYARENATAIENLGLLYDAQGKHSEAEALYQQSLAIFEASFGPEDLGTARCLENLAGAYVHQGRYAEAELLGRRAIAAYEKKLGPDHPDSIRLRDNLRALPNL